MDQERVTHWPRMKVLFQRWLKVWPTELKIGPFIGIVFALYQCLDIELLKTS